ncbi:hypothetical protein F0U61_51950 [Archangium violaceum]|uniref:hypothetical protein n=1 Tax=Archangium violaceum TaxID=83451 RepID=UPI002B283DA2|nr:hypothetical protein F0U61_51950 [Archangium violaceum]
MERLQQVPPAAHEGIESIPSLPAVALQPVPVRERLSLLLSSGVTTEEVDAFLASLAEPFLPGESPRERADLMLDVLEETRLCELTGREGRRVGLAALETLLRLGHPYAFEVTPEMLARARGTEENPLSARLLTGLGLTALNVLLPVMVLLQDFLTWLGTSSDSGLEGISPEEVISGPAKSLPLIVLMLLGPPLLALMSRDSKHRSLPFLATALQVMVGLTCLYLSLMNLPEGFWMYSVERLVALVPGILSLVIAFCLHPSSEDPAP